MSTRALNGKHRPRGADAQTAEAKARSEVFTLAFDIADKKKEIDRCTDPDDRETLNDDLRELERRMRAARPYRLYSATELDDLPPATWIVDGMIPQQGIVALIGPKGSYKSFLALDLSGHIALGAPWHGRRVVDPGHVVYVYAEGPFGAKRRLDAWCEFTAQRTRMTVTRKGLDMSFVPRGIPINDVTELAKLAVELDDCRDTPRLIVIDTLAQNLRGQEDNDGMASFAEGCARLRDRYECSVLVVHHTPLSADDRGRGHGSFDGAIDTRLIVNRDGTRVTIDCTHQRNGEDGWSLAWDAMRIGDSLAFRAVDINEGTLNGKRLEMLRLVHSEGPLNSGEWFERLGWEASKRSTFNKYRNWLKDNDFVSVSARRHAATPKAEHALMSTHVHSVSTTSTVDQPTACPLSPPSLEGESGHTGDFFDDNAA